MSAKWCIVKSCVNSFCHAEKHVETDKIFSFPTVERRKEIWIEILNADRKLLSVVKGIGVCQRHFKEEHIMKSDSKVRLYKDAFPLQLLDDKVPSTSQSLNKLAYEPHRELSSPFGGEFLRYLEKSSKTGPQLKNLKVGVSHPTTNPPGFLITEIDELEELVNGSSKNLSSVSRVIDLDKPESDDTRMTPPRLTSSASDFNLDVFDDVGLSEIKQYKTHVPNFDKITELKLHCTSCNCHIGTSPINEAIIEMHPILRVTLCKECFAFYNSGEFECGEDGSELYCRWCGQGGEVYCCSNCSYVFCSRCIEHNLSENMLTEIQNNENWKCFACAPQCLIPLRANHWALLNFIEKQKREISNHLFDEIKINELMSKDFSTCCSSNKKRLTVKRKVEHTQKTELPPEKKKPFAPIPPPRILNAALLGKKNTLVYNESVGIQNTSYNSNLSNNVDQVPIAVSNNNTTEVNPLQSTKITSLQPLPPPPLQQSPSPPLQQPPPSAIIISSPSTVQLPITVKPIYHTINGFRIDLNSAAQQETFRLPNGKLIQVRRQTPDVTQASPTQPEKSQSIVCPPPIIPARLPSCITQANPIPPERSRPIMCSSPVISAHPILNRTQPSPTPPVRSRPIMTQSPIIGAHPPSNVIRASPAPPETFRPVMCQPPIIPVHHPPLVTTSTQLSAGNSVGESIRVSLPQLQGQQPIQVHTQLVDNLNQIHAISGPIIQRLSVTPQQINLSSLAPSLFPVEQANSPIGKACTQFEERFCNSLELCQHIIGKINTLINSTSYKKVNSVMDLKDLTIHLSYLLTYAIDRFKTLQEKCVDDLKNMGFDPDNTTGATSEDDDVEIIEPKTTTISLDSDDDEVLLISTENLNVTEQLEFVSVGPIVDQARPEQIRSNNLGDSLSTDNEEDEMQVNNDTVLNLNLFYEPWLTQNVPKTIGDKTLAEKTNNEDPIIETIEITHPEVNNLGDELATNENLSGNIQNEKRNADNFSSNLGTNKILSGNTEDEEQHTDNFSDNLITNETPSDNKEDEEQNNDMIKNVLVDPLDLIDEPKIVSDTTEVKKLTENTNIDGNIIEVVEISEMKENDDPIENNTQLTHANKFDEPSASIKTTQVIKENDAETAKVNIFHSKEGDTETVQKDRNKYCGPENKKDEFSVEDNVQSRSKIVKNTFEAVGETILEDLEKQESYKAGEAIPSATAIHVKESISGDNVNNIIPEISDGVENILLLN